MMRCLRNDPVLRGVPCALRHRGTLRATRRQPELRCLASKRDKENKTWEDLAQEAGDLAKGVVQKILKAGQDAVNRSEKSDRRQESIKRSEKEGSLSRPGDFFGGLMGRAVGGLMDAMFKGVSQQIADMQTQTRSTYGSAVDRVRRSRQVQSMLGSVSCGAPYSQSTSSQSINGVTTKRTFLEFPVSGERGNGQVRVEATDQPDGKQDMQIQVQLATGQTIRVESNGGDGSGRTIDVEWKDV